MAQEKAVILRPATGRPQSVPFGTALMDASLEWTYRVRNRARFSEPGRIGHLPREACRHALDHLGVDWKSLARPGTIEVSIPFSTESEGWEARVFPWEFVLLSAFDAEARDVQILRSLKRRRSGPSREDGPVVVVESAPDAAREHRDFDAEFGLIERLFESHSVIRLTDPSEAVLRREIARLEPSVIHVSGIDSHEAEKRGYIDTRKRRNGLYLDGGTIDAPELASLLTAGGNKPRLVVFNLSFSASRIAALCVAQGAQNAVGFQDETDGDHALLLISNLIDAVVRQEKSPAEAFIAASRAAGAAFATGAVFWGTAPAPVLSLPSRGTPRPLTPLRPGASLPEGQAPEDLAGVVVRPLSQLNYALLHNDRDLFETFLIERRTDRPLHGVRVEVTVAAGGPVQPYTTSLDLEARVTDVKPLVRIPLVDPGSRRTAESLRSLLTISVCWSGIELHRSSWFVTLLPPDEWVDDPGGWPLLPSFVLSRDPFVSMLVERAGRLLRFLEDDASAGFTGYEQGPEGIDRQVQAIWATLSFDEGLTYSVPPPVFSISSQRVRTPSQISRSRSATCLDLALLFAACLESVDIYPVIFLFRGHAFPGYWRSKAAHDDFRTNPWAASGMREPLQGDGPLDETFLEVQTRVFQGDLVPLETVGLTRRSSFAEGRQTGLSNLASLSGFQALVDVKLARIHGVLPLPIVEVPS